MPVSSAHVFNTLNFHKRILPGKNFFIYDKVHCSEYGILCISVPEVSSASADAEKSFWKSSAGNLLFLVPVHLVQESLRSQKQPSFFPSIPNWPIFSRKFYRVQHFSVKGKSDHVILVPDIFHDALAFCFFGSVRLNASEALSGVFSSATWQKVSLQYLLRRFAYSCIPAVRYFSLILPTDKIRISIILHSQDRYGCR